MISLNPFPLMTENTNASIYLCTSPRNSTCSGLAGTFPGKVSHEAFRGAMTLFDVNVATGWGLMRHKGFHCYRRPESKQPEPLSKAKFKAKKKKNLKAGAFKLKASSFLNHLDESRAYVHTYLIHTLPSCFRLETRLATRLLIVYVKYTAHSSIATG